MVRRAEEGMGLRRVLKTLEASPPFLMYRFREPFWYSNSVNTIVSPRLGLTSLFYCVILVISGAGLNSQELDLFLKLYFTLVISIIFYKTNLK